MVKGLSNAHAAGIISVRADRPFASVDDVWRRAGVPASALVQIAEADAIPPQPRAVAAGGALAAERIAR